MLRGKVRLGVTETDVAAGTIALTDNATNYIEVDPATGAVSKTTTAFTDGKVPIFRIGGDSKRSDYDGYGQADLV